MNVPIRILLADDHRIITDGLKGLLSEAPDMECVLTCANGREALDALGHLAIDVVLMDIEMPVLDGLATLERIARIHPRPKTIILSMHDEPAMVQRVMELGADGYLVKDCGREELLFAIRNVHAGNRHFASSVVEGLMKQRMATAHDRDTLKELSEREVEVLAALAEGLGNKEIGERLFISPRTVDTHRTNLMRKLDTHNVAGLVRIAVKAGLVK
ncbi:MAG: response regulator transcription factor [Flavobacteriales bacterium]|nr:response regulator transcription factor [Flavobacteriales bacterium]